MPDIHEVSSSLVGTSEGLSSEGLKNIDIDDIDRELLLRQSRILYPEVEEWILEMSVEAYINEVLRCSDVYKRGT
jgi:hypothetical protein